ncbi:MAG: hypothetical protein PVH88_23180 [Ignavibacteria bacterium]|jgi:hypothetical protein
MLRLFSIIVWGLIFYLAFKAIRYLIQLIAAPAEDNKTTFNKRTDKSKFDIKSEDIIEADFEEIKESDSEKQTKD